MADAAANRKCAPPQISPELQVGVDDSHVPIDQSDVSDEIFPSEALDQLSKADVLNCTACTELGLRSEVTLGYTGWVCVRCVEPYMEDWTVSCDASAVINALTSDS